MRRTSIVNAFVLVIAASSPAWADKLDDFKEAVKNEGCQSIPYSDYRNICTSQQSDVHPWCDGSRGPVTCGPQVSAGLNEQRDREQRHLESQRDQRRELENKRSSASDEAERAKWTAQLEKLDKEIEAATRRIEDLKNDIVKRRDLVEKAMFTIGKCIDYRRAVMNVFADATDRVRAENDPDIKPYAQVLRDKYPQSISGHQKQIDEKTNALENCKKDLP